MARKNNKKYEQLTFPELQLVHARDAGPVVDAPASGALPEKNSKGNVPALIAVTPARKRAASIRAAMASEALEASSEAEVAPLVTLLADQDGVEITPAELVAAEQAAAVELAAESPVASLVSQAEQQVDQLPAVAVPETNSFPLTVDLDRPVGTTQIESREEVTKEYRPAANTHADPGARKLKVWTHLVTMASSLVVVVAVVFGSYQFYETQKLQRESIAIQKDSFEPERNAKAVELFVKYNELMMQPTTGVSKAAKREAWYWKENLAVSLLESLFNLTSGRQEWEAMVGWALEKHGRFIREQRLSCGAYTEQFIGYVEKTFAAEHLALCRERGAAK